MEMARCILFVVAERNARARLRVTDAFHEGLQPDFTGMASAS